MSEPLPELSLLAPLSGPVIAIEAVPDPVFSSKLVGPGLAIDPTSNVLLAPCKGRIVQMHRAGHALTIEAEGGQQILLHIGLDTVKLNGEGFHSLVKLEEQVEAGQELVRFDTDFIASHAKSLLTLLVLTDVREDQIEITKSKTVRGGKDQVLKIDGQTHSHSAKGRTAGTLAVSNEVRVRLETGMHARPAALLVAMAKSYPCEIQILKGPKSANAKSVVAILGLEIAHGDKVRFEAHASAEGQRAVDELAEFLEDLEEKPQSAQPEKLKTASVGENILGGVGVSSGIAIGRVHQVRTQNFKIEEQGSGDESQKLKSALKAAADELAQLSAQVKAQTDATRAAIFSAHQELLDDPDLTGDAQDVIAKGKSAAFAWNQTIQAHAERLANLNNELMANRANDLRDVGQRVLRVLLGAHAESASLPDNAILIAENLTPSETVQLDRRKVLGFCTTTGGATSHVAILARSLGLPAIAGLDPKGLKIPEGTEVVLDGDGGELRLKPSANDKKSAQAIQAQQNDRREKALVLAHQPALTRDGRAIEVVANIGSTADARQAVSMGADGVGLLRSEFLFLERDTAPSEDEQYRVYQEIADILGARPLVIRTLDVGGDKPLKYLPIEAEENPFLGIRGIRMGFLHPEVLREQLRAILRVKTKGKLCVMFPMISTIEEFRQAKALLEEERAKLGAPKVEVGIMVEVPSVALTAEAFARECDFFSVGTNDLTQFTLAMDRGHKGLAKQVDALHPSVLKLIELAATAAHRHGKWIGVCGGLASDLKAVPILLGLGIDELSVSIPSVALVKSTVRESSFNETSTLALKALAQQSAKDVRELKVTTSSNQGSTNVGDEKLVFLPAEDR